MNDLQDKTIVLIVGQPKAGTTSLFDWLSQHPQIGAGKLKELRFFLDPDYPLQSPLRFNGKNLEAYLSLFNHPERPVLLDASPDYIGCDAPLVLPEMHQNAKAIMTLRDPVERMISAYRFFQARGLIPESMSFNEYIEKQHVEGVTPKTPVQYRALDHCRADYHVDRWRKAYGKNLLVLDFKDIKADPQKVIRDICDFVGIDQVKITNTEQKNKAQAYRWPAIYKVYSGVRRWLATKTIQYPFLYRSIRPVGRLLSRLLQSNIKTKPKVHVDEEISALIMKTKTVK